MGFFTRPIKPSIGNVYQQGNSGQFGEVHFANVNPDASGMINSVFPVYSSRSNVHTTGGMGLKQGTDGSDDDDTYFRPGLATTKMAYSPVFRCGLQLNQISDVRLAIGLFDITGANNDPLTAEDKSIARMGLSFDSGRGDNNWQFANNTAAVEELTDSGVAASTDVIQFMMVGDTTAGTISYSLYDDANGQTGATQVVSTGLPGATVMSVWAGIRALAASAKEFTMIYMTIAHRFGV